ncbi:MAG: metal ABC transporter permease [Syntrophorhabdaceae bacterium]|nr:metal ABC transporter permease [Syntrophorhabdaceae bacterium]
MVAFDFISHGFIQKALIGGFFIAMLCSTLGVFLVLRNLSLIGDGLSHVTFGSVAMGLLFKLYPFYIAIPIVMVSAIGIMKLKEKTRLFSDTAIGIVSSLGIASGVFISSIAGGLNIDLFSYLFGNILAINWTEVLVSFFLSLFFIFLIIIFYQELLFITFDEESAQVSGINVKKINTMLYLMTALTVVLAMKAVGVLLVTALLILPPVTALQFSMGFKGTLFISCVIGVLSVTAGIILSFFMDFPTGATIVIINFLFFVLSLLFKKIF